MREGLSGHAPRSAATTTTATRLTLAFVIVLFCLPLFIGLGQADLETDEAIYSFAVDRILETGDWLVPRSSPSETDPFLEKPPLKFWIVAAPIKAGLLPHDEFGLRFWDAAAAGVAFAYTFAIGSLLAGPVCGLVAVLLLFVHRPLIFEHGLRTNNMEAMLMLSYCGGLFHFLRWGEGERKPRAHVLAVGLFFTLGFLVKFVAALFLPLLIALAVVALPAYRRKARRDLRPWIEAAILALVLIMPWFLYVQFRFGRDVWDTMFSVHVLTRFTGTLVPEHLQPWSYYVVTMYREFASAGAAWIVIAGLLLLVVQGILRRWRMAFVVLSWALVPLGIISAGSSKLYHYAYPFLPPVAIAGGYVIALAAMLAPAPLRRAFEAIDDAIGMIMARAHPPRRWLLSAATAITWVAAASAVSTAVFGPIKLSIGRHALYRSTGVVRPLLAIGIAGMLSRRARRAAVASVAVALIWILPVHAYPAILSRMRTAAHPLRTLRDCVLRVQAERPDLTRGLFVDTGQGFWHPIYYNLRRVRPWTSVAAAPPETINRLLHDETALRPLLISDVFYNQYAAAQARASSHAPKPPMVELLEYELLLPGPYAVCSSEAALK